MVICTSLTCKEHNLYILALAVWVYVLSQLPISMCFLLTMVICTNAIKHGIVLALLEIGVSVISDRTGSECRTHQGKL